jgi:hypothetical protein
MKSKKILIISDGKPGHLNQSIAFAKLKDLDYNILEISFRSKIFKLISYLFDKVDFYTDSIFDYKKTDFSKYDAIVSTGSNTYYFNKVISQKYNKKSIVLMLPKSYKYETFDYIVAQSHDNPPKLENIITIPFNLSFSEPKGFIKKEDDRKSVAVIIGGNNNIFTMDVETLKKSLDNIFAKFPDHKKYITTSRRTPKKIEKLIEKYEFDYKLIYSQKPDINPISDFIDICDEFFITIDSTSMISEIRANSNGNVHVIDLNSDKKNTKFHKLAFSVESIKSKIDLKKELEKIKI